MDPTVNIEGRLANAAQAFEQGRALGKPMLGTAMFGYAVYKAYEYNAFSLVGIIASAAIGGVLYSGSLAAQSQVIGTDGEGNDITIYDAAANATGAAYGFVEEVSSISTGALFGVKQLISPSEIAEVNPEDPAAKASAVTKNFLQVAIPTAMGVVTAYLAPHNRLAKTCMGSAGFFVGAKVIENQAVDAALSVVSDTVGLVFLGFDRLKGFVIGARETVNNVRAAGERFTSALNTLSRLLPQTAAPRTAAAGA